MSKVDFNKCMFLFFFMVCSQTELTGQKEALDTEHCRALETLKKQVLSHPYFGFIFYPRKKVKILHRL